MAASASQLPHTRALPRYLTTFNFLIGDSEKRGGFIFSRCTFFIYHFRANQGKSRAIVSLARMPRRGVSHPLSSVVASFVVQALTRGTLCLILRLLPPAY